MARLGDLHHGTRHGTQFKPKGMLITFNSRAITESSQRRESKTTGVLRIGGLRVRGLDGACLGSRLGSRRCSNPAYWWAIAGESSVTH